MEYLAESRWPAISTSPEGSHFTHMVLVDRTAKSQVLYQEMGFFAKQQVPAQTVRLRLKLHGMASGSPSLRLPLTTDRSAFWCDQRRI